MINEHNESDTTWKVGHNAFSDLSEEERQKLTGDQQELLAEDEKEWSKPHRFSVKELPASVDWTVKGVVTPV